MRRHLRIALLVLPLTAGSRLGAAEGPISGGVVDERIDVVPDAELFQQRALWGSVPIFFPPEPPPLGRIDPALIAAPWEGRGVLRAPPELAHFVGEPFYPALGTLLVMRELGSASRRRLEDYRAEREKLLSALRAELLRLREAPALARRERLTAFAREQTPRIVALEKYAESLRSRLTKLDYRWGANRTSLDVLGYDEHAPESAEEIADVMRAAAYYESGLLPAQRRFLREIALELPLAAHTVQESVNAQPDEFFSPGLARVRWPLDLPPDLTRKIASYQARRAALKKELYQVVFKADRAWFAIVRALELHFSLGTQAAELDRLEVLAEDIRRDLAELPTPARRPPCPPALTERLAAVLASQRTLCTGAAAALESIRRREPALDINYTVQAGGLQYAVHPRARFLPGQNSEAVRRTLAVEGEIAALAAEHKRAFATIALERAAIAAALGRALLLDAPRDIEVALLAATREAFEQEPDGPYRAYRNAVFEPGLSPEQRRLLLDSAVQQMLLPLPPGEYQPQ